MLRGEILVICQENSQQAQNFNENLCFLTRSGDESSDTKI